MSNIKNVNRRYISTTTELTTLYIVRFASQAFTSLSKIEYYYSCAYSIVNYSLTFYDSHLSLLTRASFRHIHRNIQIQN